MPSKNPRIYPYISEDSYVRLQTLAKRPGHNESEIVDRALAAFFSLEHDDKRDAALIRRLDRMTRQFEDLKRKQIVSAEAFALFVRHYLMVMMPDAEAERVIRLVGSHIGQDVTSENPNVFQICTLNQTKSADKKRQEIGRGLRLPVNTEGERVHDETVNRLTVIANESYEEFARTLQNEFEEDVGIRFGIVDRIAFAKIVVTDEDGNDTPLGQEQSTALWQSFVEEGYLGSDGAIQTTFVWPIGQSLRAFER